MVMLSREYLNVRIVQRCVVSTGRVWYHLDYFAPQPCQGARQAAIACRQAGRQAGWLAAIDCWAGCNRLQFPTSYKIALMQWDSPGLHSWPL